MIKPVVITLLFGVAFILLVGLSQVVWDGQLASVVSPSLKSKDGGPPVLRVNQVSAGELVVKFKPSVEVDLSTVISTKSKLAPSGSGPLSSIDVLNSRYQVQSAKSVFRRFTDLHLEVGLKAMSEIAERGEHIRHYKW